MIHFTDDGIKDFSYMNINALRPFYLGLLRRMPTSGYLVTLSTIANATEEWSGGTRPYFKAYFPGYTIKELTTIEAFELTPNFASDWSGVSFEPLTFSCNEECTEENGRVPDVVGFYVYGAGRLYWVEEFEDEIFMDRDEKKLTANVDMLARCKH